MKPVRQSELLNAILRVAGVATVESPAAEAAPVLPRPLKILLAEDHPANQILAVQLLTKRGHAVTVAENGKEAVDRLAAEDFDVVLMDVQMPVMDGFAATAAIRDPNSAVRRHDVPIVAMTAHALKGDRDRCLAAGMDGYVAKPVTARALMAALASLFGTDPGKGAMEEASEGAETRAEDAAIFDRAGLLARVEGDAVLARRMATLFLDSAVTLLAGIDEAATASDAEALARCAHTLKGSVATMGGRRAQEACLRMETAARRGDLDGARGVVSEVAGEVRALERALRGFVGAESASGREG